jgi:TRAP-type C4-dicarboxylate transport system permease small subunit
MDHLEADHKFFRSLILVFLFAWPFLLWSYYRQDGLNPFLGLLLLLLLPMFPFKMFRSVVRSWLVGQAGWLSKILIIPIGLTLILVTWQCWTFVRSLDKSPWLQVVMLLPLGALGLGFAVWWHQYKFFKNRRGLRLSVSDDSAYLKDQLARGQLCVLILLLAGSVVWLLGTALSENNPPAQAQTAPEKNDKALAGGQTTMPLSSISVTAVSGTMSVTATTEHKYSDTNATPPPRIWVAASLCFGIALSFVRFFQQRLRYTKVAYRTFLVIADAPSEGGEQKPKGRDTV